MNILNILRKDTTQVEERANYNATIEALFSNNTYISKDSIIKIPVVQESVKKICGTISSLPIEMIQKDQLKNTIIEEDVRLYLLNVENNDYSTAYNLKYKIVEDLLLYGKHYSYIKRSGTKILELWPIDFKTVSEQDSVDSSGVILSKEIHFTLNTMVQVKNAYDILIIDSGNKGILNSDKLLSLLTKHSEMLESAITNISAPSGYLKSEQRLTQTTIDRMRESWRNLYSGSKNAAKTIILEEGLDYKQLSLDLNSVQADVTKKGFVEDVERLFNLHNLKSDSDYLKYTITPLVSCIELGLTTQLLKTSEKENHTMFRFDCEMVDRATEKERVESIVTAVKGGLLTINEARLRLDENPFLLDSKEEFLSLSMGNIMLKQNGTVVLPNMGTSIDMGADTNTIKEENVNGNIKE